MQELIAAVAEATGWPASMVERSARARAQAQGVTVEAVLAAWAGGGAIDASATTTSGTAEPAPAGEAEAVVAPAVEATPELEVEVLETAPAAEPEVEPEVEPEPEVRRRPTVPTWLAASFVILPAIAIVYALFFPNGPGCGVGAQLGIDAVTGEAENCSGGPYGFSEFDFFTAGEETYASYCAACHGADGGGGGNFPTLSGGSVAATFPQCGDHLEWVRLGTLGWPDATYGANALPVGGSGAVMPSFASALTPEQLVAVVLFERVAFGSLALPDVEADCDPAALVAAAE